MLRVTASNKDKLVTLIVAEDAFNYIRPALTKDQQDALLSEIIVKLLNNQESEKETLYLKTILFTNSRRDNATAYLAHESTNNFNKPKMYRFTLEGIDTAALHPYWPTVARNVSSRDIRDADAKFSAMAAPVFISICSQDHPPIQLGDNIIRINHPNDEDTHDQLARIWLREHENDNSRAMTIADIVTGDTQQALVDVKDEACQNIQAPLQAFIAKQKTQDESAAKSLQTYRATVCDRLQSNLDEQLAIADKSISTDTQQINELSNPVNAAVNNYLQAKYEYVALCKPLAAALHNAAKKYYISRWSTPANRGNKKNLEAERNKFNAIFNGIAQINEDFSLTPVESTIKIFSTKSIIEQQELLANVLNMSYTKTEPHDAFHFLHAELNKYNGEANHSQGNYFTPFVRHTMLKAAINHTFTFTTAFIEKYEAYRTCKTIVSKIPAAQLETIATEIDNSKSRIKFAVAEIASDAGKKLAIAEDNISKFSTLINKQQEFRDQIDTMTEQLQTMGEKAEPLTLNLEPLQALNLPPQVANDLADHLNAARFEETRDAIFGTIDELQQDIMREQRSLADVIGEAKTTAETLKPLDVDKEIGTISHVLQSTQECIETTNGMITETEEALQQPVQVLQNLQAVTSALQGINDFKSKLHVPDPSNEQFPTIANDACKLFENATNSFFPFSNLERRLPKSVEDHLSHLQDTLATDERNTSDILRCHFLLSGLLNFNYWESTVGHSKKKGLVIDEAGHNHWIHQDIINLLAIAKRIEFTDWNTNADTARKLLDELASYQPKTTKNTAVMRFMEIAKEKFHTLTTLSMDSEHHDLLTKGMFPTPPLSPLIRPERLRDIQTIGKRSYFKRHPWVKTALIIGGIVLVAGAIGVGVYFAVLALPAAALTALTLGIMTLIKTGTLAPIIAGIVTAFAGLGALIGRAIGKRQAAKHEAKLALIAAREQERDREADKENEDRLDAIAQMISGWDDPRVMAAPQPTEPRVQSAGVRTQSVPAADAVAQTGSNPFGDPERMRSPVAGKTSTTGLFAAKPNPSATAKQFREACIREHLAALGTKKSDIDQVVSTYTKQHQTVYFNSLMLSNGFRATVSKVLDKHEFANFDPTLLHDHPAFEEFVTKRQTARDKRDYAF